VTLPKSCMQLQYYVSMAKQNSTAAQIHCHGDLEKVIIEWKLKEHVRQLQQHAHFKERSQVMLHVCTKRY